MYRRRPFQKELDICDLEAQISALKSDLSAPESEDDASPPEIEYDDVITALKKENASLKEFIDFQNKKKEKLIEEEKRISKHIEEDENIISLANDFVTKNVFFATEELTDNKTELFFKMEVLHRKLCRLIKKFSHNYLSDINMDETDLDETSDEPRETPNEPRETSAESLETSCAKTGNAPKKSILDILKMLIFELGAADFISELEVDDTLEDKHIQFLLYAGIVERCRDNPKCVKLKISDE